MTELIALDVALGVAVLATTAATMLPRAQRAGHVLPGSGGVLMILVWLRLGSSDSGGAFQSGAVLAGALILLRSAGVPLDRLTGRWLRPLLIVGMIGFILTGALAVSLGNARLGWSPEWSFAAMLTVEIALTAGISLVTLAGTTRGVVHLVHQGLMKIALFFCAGLFAEALGITKLSQMHGLGRRMPWTSAAFTVGAFGMIGLPVTAGFVSEWMLGLGALESEHPWVVGVLIASSLLNAMYFLPAVYRMWFRDPGGVGQQHRDVRRQHGRAAWCDRRDAGTGQPAGAHRDHRGRVRVRGSRGIARVRSAADRPPDRRGGARLMLFALTFLVPIAVVAVVVLAGVLPAQRTAPVRRGAALCAPLAAVPAGLLAVFGGGESVDVPWLLFGTRFSVDAVARPLLLIAALLYGGSLLALA